VSRTLKVSAAAVAGAAATLLDVAPRRDHAAHCADLSAGRQVVDVRLTYRDASPRSLPRRRSRGSHVRGSIIDIPYDPRRWSRSSLWDRPRRGQVARGAANWERLGAS
jgi:hypothetical protein